MEKRVEDEDEDEDGDADEDWVGVANISCIFLFF